MSKALAVPPLSCFSKVQRWAKMSYMTLSNEKGRFSGDGYFITMVRMVINAMCCGKVHVPSVRHMFNNKSCSYISKRGNGTISSLQIAHLG